MEERLKAPSSQSFGHGDGSRVIYTHGAKSRLFVMLVLVFYLALFGLFSNFASKKWFELNDLPAVFMQGSDFEITKLIYTLVGGVAWLAALVLLLYFLWAVVDIWGLQVSANEKEIRVQNTILGQSLNRWTGVGAVAMEEIIEIEARPLATYLVTEQRKLRFSPVEGLDRLVATILANAKNARIVE